MGTRAPGSQKTPALAELGQCKEPSLPRCHGWLCHPQPPRPKPSTRGVPKGHPKQGLGQYVLPFWTPEACKQGLSGRHAVPTPRDWGRGC